MLSNKNPGLQSIITFREDCCVVVVDPYSTGAMVVSELLRRDFRVIALWTKEVGENRGHYPAAADGVPDACYFQGSNGGHFQFSHANWVITVDVQ